MNICFLYLPSFLAAIHYYVAFPLVDILFITKEPLLIPKVLHNAYLSGKVPLWIYTVGFLHQYNWPPRYSWNIVESGTKNPNPNPTYYLHLVVWNFLKYDTKLYISGSNFKFLNKIKNCLDSVVYWFLFLLYIYFL
jgi:hypothetical protein